jgi:hypothetical protein
MKYRVFRSSFFMLLILLGMASTFARSAFQVQTKSTSEVEVQHLMADFLTAFDNLDWPAFRKLWIEDPIVFQPLLEYNPTGKRVEGAVEFEKSWQEVFDAGRKFSASRGVTKAPYMNIQPQDLRIDILAPTVAVVTFHLPSPDAMGRRMFVAVKTDNGWKISHLHASTISLTPPK